MIYVRLFLASCLLLPPCAAVGATVFEIDVCVYGGTSGGVVAAVQAARMGKTVALLVVNNHLGGMSSSGLGWTDIGHVGNGYIQGLSREFYTRIGQKYGTGVKFTFEPRVAETVFREMAQQAGVTVHTNQYLVSVAKEGARIVAATMHNGNIFRAKEFIDASYEGDLMAAAGVSYIVGREASAQYGESLNGIRAPNSDFTTLNIDPYVVSNTPASGLLPLIQSGAPGTPGEADQLVQAYNFRLCLTTTATNKLPIAAPTNYNPAQFELLARYIQARVAQGSSPSLGDLITIETMPNGKTDINNRGPISTDFIGESAAYIEADYDTRRQIWQAHKDYMQGFLYFLGTDSRVPSSVRSSMLSYGLTKDEFADNGGWPYELYVREARRMVSDYVMTQSNVFSQLAVADSIGMAGYFTDSHYCQRVVVNGVVRNEGNARGDITQPYPISYRAIISKASECSNLIVPWSLSASHTAFSSLRMEPVFMILGQAAGTAACFAIDDNLPVQSVNYDKLALQLVADAQVLNLGEPATSVIVDNLNTGFSATGVWSNSTATAGYWAADYVHDGNVAKGAKSATFTPTLTAAGLYEIALRWTAHVNRATSIPVDVIHPGGTNTFIINQTANGGAWILLLTTNLGSGTSASLRIRTTGTTGFIVADAARWLPVVSNAPAVQLIASDPVANESGKVARLLFSRPAASTNAALTVHYKLSGTASNGVDFTALPGSITLPIGVFVTNLTVSAFSDAIPEGDKTLIVSLEAGTNYSIGAFSNATIRIFDTPFDGWRFAHFTAAELAQSQISGPDADPDNDGASNWHEFLAGTNPRDTASVLRVSLDVQANLATIQFFAGSNHAYTLQYRDSASTGSWFDLTNIAAAVINRTILYQDAAPLPVTNRFYRVRAP